MFKDKLSINKLVILLFINLAMSGCKADNNIAKTLYDTFRVEHDFTIYEKSSSADKPNYNGFTDPQIFIQAVTPIKCEDLGTGNDYRESISSCTLIKPLPKDLTLRYGRWLTRNEEEQQFSEPAYVAYREKAPNPDNYKTYREWKEASNSYWQQVEQLPQFKAYNQTRKKSIDNIQWHTITIHPQAIMDKYKDKNPEEEVSSFSRYLPYLQNTEVTLFITVNPDMSVTLKEDYHYKQSGKPSYH